MTGRHARPAPPALPDPAGLVAETPRDALYRLVLAVATMHEPGRCGRCRHCQPARRWRRRSAGPCPTWRVLVAELRTAARTGRWSG